MPSFAKSRIENSTIPSQNLMQLGISRQEKCADWPEELGKPSLPRWLHCNAVGNLRVKRICLKVLRNGRIGTLPAASKNRYVSVFSLNSSAMRTISKKLERGQNCISQLSMIRNYTSIPSPLLRLAPYAAEAKGESSPPQMPDRRSSVKQSSLLSFDRLER